MSLRCLGKPIQVLSLHRLLKWLLGQYYGHNLDAKTLKELPNQINQPIAVMESAKTSTNSDAFIVLTKLIEEDVLDGEKKPVIASLILKETNNGVELVNITSVHGRNTRQIQQALRGKVFYWDKAKGSQFMNAFQLQLPSQLRSDASLSKANIKTNLDLAQEESLKNQYDVKFSMDDAEQSSFDKTAKRLGGKKAYL